MTNKKFSNEDKLELVRRFSLLSEKDKEKIYEGMSKEKMDALIKEASILTLLMQLKEYGNIDGKQ